MITSANTFWTILTTHLPIGRWVNIIEIYQTIETNIGNFTLDDLAVPPLPQIMNLLGIGT